MIYLLIVATWIVDIFQVKFMWHVGGSANPSRPLPVFHHKPSYAQTTKSKLSPIKNPHDMDIHNSLSNVAIHMPCANIYCVGYYELEIVFVCVSMLPIVMSNILQGLTAFNCLCSIIKRYM